LVNNQGPEPLHRTALSGGRLDRLHDRRSDEDWLIQQRGVSGHVHLTWQGHIIVREGAPSPLAASDAPHPHTHVFLGELEGELHWTVDLSDRPRSEVEALLHPDASLMALREASGNLSEDHANVLGFAAGMAYWHQTHQFCGSCGASTTFSSGGHERKCTACSQVHWPRTDPAVIMLVIDQVNDRALLGRQKIWPPKMYSTLAGFVEPGESLEDAVARETYEEAGIRVGQVRYWCSQPWPFPRSVMLGFHALYRSGEVVPHPTEMDDVRWFDRHELFAAREAGRQGRAPIEGGALFIPPSVTISRALIDAWLDERVRFEP
jgi:NAD+ diphosphatase